MKHIMQARSSLDGKIYTWRSDSAAFDGADYSGPGAPEEIAVLQRPAGGAGLRVLGSVEIPNSILPAGSASVVIATVVLATAPGPALAALVVSLDLGWVATPPSDLFLSLEIMIDGDPLDPPVKWRFGMFPTMGNIITTCTLLAPIEIVDSASHNYIVKATASANTTTTLGSGVPGRFAVLR